MIIAAIDELQKKGLFTKDSKFPNISIMLSLLLKYAWMMGRGGYGFDDNIDWVFYVVQQAEAADITLGGPSGFEKTLKEIKDELSKKTAASLSKMGKGKFINKVCCFLGSKTGLSAQAKLTQLCFISSNLTAHEAVSNMSLQKCLLPREKSTLLEAVEAG